MASSFRSIVRFQPLFSRAIIHPLCTDRRRMETLISQIAQLLNHTLSPEGNVVGSATEGLDHLSLLPDFPFALLAISTEGENQGQRIAAATYLKNFTRRHIDGDRSSKASVDFRNRLVHALLQVEPAVLKILVEAFRIIIVNEFVKENSWPELVPELRSVIQNSNLISGGANCQWNTINALTILQAIIKPFQYFLNPKVKKEPVPSQLELIATEILVPLLAIFHHLVEKALSTQGKTEMEIERILLTVCKCVYFAVRSYMPSALVPLLPSFCRDIFVILGLLNLDGTTWGDSFLLRLRTGKRSLLIFCSLVTRHRKHSDKLMPSIVSCVSKIVMQSNNISKLDFLSERIMSLAFDVLSHILETGPGWRLVSPHFSALLDSAVFPALVMNQKDISEWDEDADEYIRKNLPSDLEDISGWKEDLFTARKSAINLLGVISVAKGPPMLTSSNNSSSASGKRKKGDKSKGRAQHCSMGDLLVLPFLSKFPVPSGASAGEINDYYGVLMAYGSLQDFLREQNPVQTATLLQTRVLPVYSLFPCPPYLVANANWVLGELASCLPEEMSTDVYASLLKALIMPDMGDISCYPVRASAAGAIAELLENDYLPSDWLPLLQVVVNKTDNEDDNEASILFQLLSSILEAASENIAVHIPYIVSILVGTISKRIPPIPEPWPQVVEGGFAALAVMAQTWEDSVPDDAEMKSSEAWRSGQATITRTFSALLQQAWLKPIQQMEEDVAELPPSSCIDNISKLLQFIMKSVTEPNTVSELKLSELLMVWAEVVADWHAWEELEDLSIFESIPEVVNLHQKCDLKNFIIGRLPSPPAPPVPQRSIIEGIAEFVSEAISQYPSATWRACSCVHLLLHKPTFSFEAEGVNQGLVFAFSQAAFSHFKEIQSKPSALWKPLLLAISSCYLCSPDIVERVLEKVVDNGFTIWVSALRYISSSSFEPALSSESEIKLIVMALMKVVERLLGMPVEPERGLLQDCFVSLMEAVIHLKEVQEEEENEDDEVEYADENDEAEDIDEDEESEDDEHEETEEEFLDRYAEAALNLESTLDVEEGDVEDQDQELELGVFGEVDQQRAVLSLIERYHHILIKGQTLPPHLVTGLLNAFPDYASFLQHS